MRRLVVALWAGLFATGAFARECAKQETQREINECYSDELRRSEQVLTDRLNTVRSRLQERLPDALPSFELAQEAWVVYRDAECAFALSSAGGTSYPTDVALCKEQLTGARADRLKKYLDCKEGETACPVPNP